MPSRTKDKNRKTKKGKLNQPGNNTTDSCNTGSLDAVHENQNTIIEKNNGKTSLFFLNLKKILIL